MSQIRWINEYSHHHHYLYHYHHLHYLYYCRHHHHNHLLKAHFPSVGPTGVCWAVDKGDAVWRRLGAKVIVWPRIGNVVVVVIVVVVVVGIENYITSLKAFHYYWLLVVIIIITLTKTCDVAIWSCGADTKIVVWYCRDIVAKTILKASTALNNWGQNQSIPGKHIWTKSGTQIWLKSILEIKSDQNPDEVNQSWNANPTEIFRKSINAITNNANPTKIWRKVRMVVPTRS